MRISLRFMTTMMVMTVTSALVLTGCPGSLDDIERFRVDSGGLAPPLDGGPLDCPTTTTRTLAACAAAGCHSAAVPAGNLDLSTADPRPAIRNKPSFGNPSFLLIDTANFQKSALYTKTGAGVPFGLPMPTTGAPLDEATRACLLQWVEATPVAVPEAGSPEAGSSDAAAD